MRHAPVFLAFLFAFSAIGADCTGVSSLSSEAPTNEECGDGGCFNTTVRDAGASDVSTDIGTDAPLFHGKPVNPLCGDLRCNPDDTDAVDCLDESSDESDGGEAGAPMHKTPQQRTDNPKNLDGGAAPVPEAGKPHPGEGADSPAYACQVIRSPIGDRTSTCLAAGDGEDGSPCLSSRECAPGLVCVGLGGTDGVCRSYCCLDSESCPEDTYCAPRKTNDQNADAGVSSAFYVPVCVPAAPCNLVPQNGLGSGCADGKVCAVVRSDGTTGCVLPGNAQEGQPCDESEIEVTGRSPCAEGLVCSRATNQCMRFCLTTVSDSCGDGGFCQGGVTSIPAPYGVCVGSR